MLTWQNRSARILARERDLFGRLAGHWRVIRISNADVFNAGYTAPFHESFPDDPRTADGC